MSPVPQTAFADSLRAWTMRAVRQQLFVGLIVPQRLFSSDLRTAFAAVRVLLMLRDQ